MGRLIGIAGAQSTGKTTLARATTIELEQQGHSVYLVREEAMRFFALHPPDKEPIGILPVQQHFLNQQYVDERTGLVSHVDFVITDSPTFLSAVYLQRQSETLSPTEKELMIDLVANCGRLAQAYEKVFVIPHDAIPMVERPGRIHAIEERDQIHRFIVTFVEGYGIPHTILGMDPKNWVKEIVEALF